MGIIKKEAFAKTGEEFIEMKIFNNCIGVAVDSLDYWIGYFEKDLSKLDKPKI